MHKHQDGKKFTPPAKKLKSTAALHAHGDDYTLAPNEAGHTHLNKDTKARTSGPVDLGQKAVSAIEPTPEMPKEVTKPKKNKKPPASDR